MPAQLAPFNEEQFDRCSLWLVKNSSKSLTQYDLVKFHVMADIYHVLQYGMPIIGGPLAKWKFGPVVPRAYHRLRSDIDRFERGKEAIGPLTVLSGRQNVYRFVAPEATMVDEEEFSQSELEAMKKALDVVGFSFSFDESQAFFHDPEKSFIGKAWHDAQDGCPIDWISIIDAYDAWFGTNHDHIKKLIALGV